MEKVVDAAFWSGRKVFLTGHTGFKGGWLALWLSELGASVHGYALPPEGHNNLFQAARIEQTLSRSTLADIRDHAKLAACMQAADPSIVLHLAAQPLVRRSYQQPLETLATNVMGTAHVLEAARACQQIEAIVVITTDKCYENQEWPWAYREADPLGGHDPYSSSKACAEWVASCYRRSFPESCASVATARAGNVIGGGDWATNRLVPDLLQAFSSGQSLSIRSPEAIRPWQHVLEPLAGYLLLAERLASHKQDAACAWNFGPPEDSNQPVAWVADRLAALWGQGAGWHRDTRHQLHEAQTLRLDSSRARTLLGWQPRWSLDQALTATLGWYQSWLRGENMQAICLQQIHDYLRH